MHSRLRLLVRVLCSVGQLVATGAVHEASAQTVAASVHVLVVGAPSLAGAVPTVSIERSGPLARRRAAVLEGVDAARFTGLPASTYEVTVSVAGADTVAIELRVEAREVVTLRATMAPAGQGLSRIDVAGRHREGEGTDLTGRLLEDLPGAEDVWSLVETAAPFVVIDRMDTGGLGLGYSPFVSGRGESWALSEVVLGDLRVAYRGRAGLLAMIPDSGAVQAAAVTSGLAPVERGTPGVQLVLTPKSAGPQWMTTLRSSVTTPGMVATNALPDAPSVGRIEYWRQAGLEAGGPVSDRTGLFLSGGLAATRQQDRGRADRLFARSSTVFANLVSRVGDRDQIRVLGGAERARAPFEDRRQFRDDTVDEHGTFGRLQLTWDRVGRNGSRVALSAGAERSTFTPDVASGTAGGTVDRVLDGVVPLPAASVRTSAWNGRVEFGSPVIQRGGVLHAMRAGLSADRASSSAAVLTAPIVAETVAGLPARVWVPNLPTGRSLRETTEVAAYVNDSISLSPRFTIDAGLRVDLRSGSAEGAAVGIDWRTLSPRVSFRWSRAPVAVFGGFGRYASGVLMPLLAFGSPGGPTSDVHRWTDPNGNGAFDPGEAGVLVARAGRGSPVASIDSELQAPLTDEWTIGGQYHPGAGMTLHGAIIVRRQSRLPGAVNTGVPLSAYRRFVVPDINADQFSPDDDQLLEVFERLPSSFGQDFFLLTNPARAEVAYDGIEVGWELRSSRWSSIFGATAYRATGWGGYLGAKVVENDPLVIGDRFDRPDAPSDTAGRLFFDRAYVGKWSGVYHAPRDLRVGFAARYQDGQPFARLVVLPDLAGGPEVVHGYAVGRTRFTYTATLDLRVEKGLAFDRMRRAAIAVEIFNLTNHTNEVDEDIVTGPTFRRSTLVQPPRTLRIGLQLDF